MNESWKWYFLTYNNNFQKHAVQTTSYLLILFLFVNILACLNFQIEFIT